MYTNELYHHGVKGQKWGVRHFQNKDGSYKPGAEGRYDGDGKISRAIKGVKSGLSVRKKNHTLSSENKKLASQNKKLVAQNKKLSDKSKEEKEGKKFELSDRQKKAIKIGAAVAGTALAAYGAKKLYDHIDATNKGKALAKKLLDDAGGDFESASRSIIERQNRLMFDKNTGQITGKAYEKGNRMYEATRRSIADTYRKAHFEDSQLNKDMRYISDVAKARRKEQLAKATNGVRDVADKVGNRAKSGADIVRSKAGETAKNARSAYERNAGERMAKSINRSYANRERLAKAKTAASYASSKVSNAAKAGAASARNTASKAASSARSAYERNAGERMAKSINNSYARRQAMNRAKAAARNLRRRGRS